MGRYFMEVAYKGTRYSGFQKQENAITVQSEVEAAFQTIHRVPVALTGSSRTDAGVHAHQNFFHFDYNGEVHPEAVYKLNAILPLDIAVRQVRAMPDEAHSRFDATSREYSYHLHRSKDPFLNGASLYYPYAVDMELMQAAADFIATQSNFYAFSKTNTQVKNFHCAVFKSQWTVEEERLTYTIEASRFLRGMVRLLTATLLQVGRGKISLAHLESFFLHSIKCGLSLPPQGLYLNSVRFPDHYTFSRI